jgi:signal transduction histidine kinase
VTCAIRDISRRKAAEDDARKLGGHLLKMQDVERRRIARELHDNAGQIIAALTINLELIKSAAHLGPREEKILTESDSMLQNLGTDLRTISHLLHPPLLDEIGLPCALKEYVDGFARRSGIATKLELASDFGRLTSDSEIALFRIVQECLTNIHRHSGSPEATVRLMRSFDEITLEVNDKGCGMRLEASGPRVLGVGLRGMQERVLQLGGKLDIQSGIGTTVTTTLPISTALAPAISDIE